MAGSHKSQVLILNNEVEISVRISTLNLNIKDNALAFSEFQKQKHINY
jgi:hypothetical protein